MPRSGWHIVRKPRPRFICKGVQAVIDKRCFCEQWNVRQSHQLIPGAQEQGTMGVASEVKKKITVEAVYRTILVTDIAMDFRPTLRT